MFNLHFESRERIHEGDGHVGVEVVAASLELGVRVSSDLDNLKNKLRKNTIKSLIRNRFHYILPILKQNGIK